MFILLMFDGCEHRIAEYKGIHQGTILGTYYAQQLVSLHFMNRHIVTYKINSNACMNIITF